MAKKVLGAIKIALNTFPDVELTYSNGAPNQFFGNTSSTYWLSNQRKSPLWWDTKVKPTIPKLARTELGTKTKKMITGGTNTERNLCKLNCNGIHNLKSSFINSK